MSANQPNLNALQRMARSGYRFIERISRKPYVQGLPEWSMFPDEASRLKAIEEVERGMRPTSLKTTIQFLMAVAVFLAIPFAVSHLLAAYLLPNMGRWNRGIMWAGTLIGYTILVYLALRRNMPKELRKQLIKAGVPVCLKCGYDLRGLPADRTVCPECGRAFDADVQHLVRQPNQDHR